MRSNFLKYLILVLLCGQNFFVPVQSFAGDLKSKALSRNPELQTPTRLRPRVNFWIDIFGRYTKAQVIIHHRRYPQIRFALLDIADETAGMNDVLFDTYKDRALKAKLKEVRDDIALLATGAAPSTNQQRNIETAMRALGPGVAKYKNIIDSPDLVRGQSGIREKTREAIQRSGRYLPIIEDIFVNEFSLPVELSRLPFVESSFDYRAYSSAAAAGIWQFIPRTARSYMRLTSTIDERLDPIEATRAAAKYFRSAYSRLGTWPLALTSYNHGVGGVLNRVRKFGTADISLLIESSAEPPPFGFASANFFPSYLAAKEIYDRRQEFFPGVFPEPSLRIATLRLENATNISEIRRRVGVSEDELRSVNYALSERVWKGQALLPAGYNLKVPEEYGTSLMKAGLGIAGQNFDRPAEQDIQDPKVIAALAKERTFQPTVSAVVKAPVEEKPLESKKVVAEESVRSLLQYKVKPGDTLYSIARSFGVSVPELKAENDIKGSAVYVGKQLRIPGKRVATSRKPAPKEALTKLYTVKKGDTLASIAKKLSVPLQKLKERNGLNGKKAIIKTGQVLKLPG